MLGQSHIVASPESKVFSHTEGVAEPRPRRAAAHSNCDIAGLERLWGHFGGLPLLAPEKMLTSIATPQGVPRAVSRSSSRSLRKKLPRAFREKANSASALPRTRLHFREAPAPESVHTKCCKLKFHSNALRGNSEEKERTAGQRHMQGWGAHQCHVCAHAWRMHGARMHGFMCLLCGECWVALQGSRCMTLCSPL